MRIEKEIHCLEECRLRAMLDADTATPNQLLADDVVYAHSNAERDTKNSYLTKLHAKDFDYERIEYDIDRVIVAEIARS